MLGIISVITISVPLSQRVRTRDKAAQKNLAGRIGELADPWDKFREKGCTYSSTRRPGRPT